MKLYIAADTKENMLLGKRLGAKAILTNAKIVLDLYGENMTLQESTERMLQESGLPVFQSIHGESVKDIIDKGLSVCKAAGKLNKAEVGLKIIASRDGFQAIKVLSEQGIKCIVTGLYTVHQAMVAAQVKAFAISPFIARGKEAGLDMEECIKAIRAIYDRMQNPPEILAASIRTLKDVDLAARAGADGVAISVALIKEMIDCEYSRQTEDAFGYSFARIKGEDVSYLHLPKKNDTEQTDE
ncbi:MAG: hypothetical protein LBR25_00085 [Erysipelotrichaceae bacterium]|jgi:transaldolase|nr:hypothetical protein [Erysipelotrichaceae bacterium]